jgi:uncharacterized low-complexity protein
MKKLLQLGLILAASAALSFTMINASGEEAPNAMKCNASKDMKCNTGKDMKKETNTTKPAPEKGKCGQGKCG